MSHPFLAFHNLVVLMLMPLADTFQIRPNTCFVTMKPENPCILMLELDRVPSYLGMKLAML